MDTRETIISLLRATGREGIENVISLIESSDFFSIGCHSHHTYPGGLADHCLQTLALARKHDSGIADESLVIASLLHDICDINRYRKLKGHGWRSAALLTRCCGLELTRDEWNAIRYHMRHRCERPMRTPLELAVYNADKKSAHKGRGYEI